MHDATALRHELHRFPELSHQEAATARRIEAWMKRCSPDDAVLGLGGQGAAFAFDGPAPGPRVLLRCELDALPIEERAQKPYRSENPGVSHQCGHDGHMAILAAVADSLAERRPARGRVILLFQPAEETGEGAARVLADPRFAHWRPDRVFALHNLPGWPLSQVILRRGAFNCASVGLDADFEGSSSHAAHPEDAVSPTQAIASLLASLPSLPAREALEGALLTLTHARIGEPALGITPGKARLMATLRAPSDEALGKLAGAAESAMREAATEAGVALTLQRREPFRALVNDAQACDQVQSAARRLGLETLEAPLPLPWSEDFSEFTHRFPGALFGLGSGVECPPLHSPDYDFPDALIDTGARLFRQLIDDLLGRA